MNKGPDHLSRLEHGEELTNLEDTLPNAHLLSIRKMNDKFTDIFQFLKLIRDNAFKSVRETQIVGFTKESSKVKSF